MRRKAIALVAAAAALVVAVTVVVIFRGPASDEAATGVHNTRAPQDIASHWTKERMNEASPG
ncbi:hypothetical protein [Nonomuraea aurantiaca]|uniref:hypothetical protein n=1 Tax=Nonomuraea aurantiaca TaxID=2878562 RepID=UPI001CD9BCB9|nr:hypothetical protein [Nonomuraea aurantiaca]MCA2220395.1 hypothetical protein [Nonomuraea aurantiaca]